MVRLSKGEKASKDRLLSVRLPWIQALLKKDKKIKIGPIFPERNMTETDVRSDPKGIVKYRLRRQAKKRVASHSRAYNIARS